MISAKFILLASTNCRTAKIYPFKPVEEAAAILLHIIMPYNKLLLHRFFRCSTCMKNIRPRSDISVQTSRSAKQGS